MHLRYGRVLNAALFTLGTLLAVSACSKGNGSTIPAPTPTPANSVTFAVTPTGSTVTLPQAYGLVGTATFPSATTGAGTALTFAETGASAPSGLPNLNAPNVPVLFFSLTPAANVAFSGFPGFSITLPSSLNISNSTFYLGFYDPKNTSAGWKLGFGGPATVSGQTVTFAPTSTAFSMTSGLTYNYVLYAVNGGATPTPPPNTAFIFESSHAAGAARNIVNVFPGNSNGNVIPVNSFTDAAGPNALAFAPNNKLYAANQSASITVYTVDSTGTATLATTITSPALTAPQFLAFDATNNIFVTQNSASGGIDSVQVFAAASSGASTPSATIAGAATGLSIPQGIAVDSTGISYVANNGNSTVTEYAAGANGNVAPVATIGGALTTLANPTGLAVDSAGNIYVANANNSILVFAKGTTGNKAPTATIAGGNTGLNLPAELALDSLSKLYVASTGANSVLSFPVSATGNAFPAQTITGPSTNIAAPFGVAAH